MMKENFMKRGGKIAFFSLSGLGGLLILCAFFLQAQVPVPPPVPWTAAASTGVVDESSVGRYLFNGACADKTIDIDLKICKLVYGPQGWAIILLRSFAATSGRFPFTEYLALKEVSM